MSIYTMRTKLGHQIKWLLGLVAVSVMVGAAYQFGGSMGPGGGGSNNDKEVIATANGIDITRSEFENTWLRVQEEYEQMGMRSPFMLANLRSMLFSQIVQSKVMLAAAQQEGVPISKREVRAEVDKQVTEFLKLDRERALGKVSKEQAKTDPRKDEAYKKELAAIDSSIAQREDYAKQMISEDQIRIQLAMKGLEAKIKSTVKPVTDADIKDSYNEYKATLILLSKAGGSAESVRKKADGIRNEAIGGADFKALAKTHDTSGFKATGSQVTYSFDNPGMPEEVASAVKKLQPGQVSPVIDADYGYVIVKLDSVTQKLPKTMDKKTTDARRKTLAQDRESKATMAFQKKVNDAMKVDVKDPELRAYWTLGQAQKYFQTEMDRYNQMKSTAITALKEAVAKNENNIVASAKLAELYTQDGKFKEAAVLLNGMLADVEDPEMRKMLGDVQVKLGAKDKALENYQMAVDSAEKNNPDVLRQIIASYQQMDRADLAKATEVKLAEYEKRKAQFDAQEQENAPAPAPAPKKP